MEKEAEERAVLLPEHLYATENLFQPAKHLVRRYLRMCSAARIWTASYPGSVIDHITPRSVDIKTKALPFIRAGWTKITSYRYADPEGGWLADVYVHPQSSKDSFQPVLFVDQGVNAPRGDHLITRWIAEFPEEDPSDFLLHHIAVRVDDIEKAIAWLEGQGIEFVKDKEGKNNIRSCYDGTLRQIFTQSEMLAGAKSKKPVPGPLFELIQRHPALEDWRFEPGQAGGLMQDSVVQA